VNDSITGEVSLSLEFYQETNVSVTASRAKELNLSIDR